MKIAIVLNTSWNAYNFRMGLIRVLQNNGHEIHVFAPKDGHSHFLIEAGCEFHNVKMDSRGANPIKDTALIFELFGLYKKHRPDIILHYTIKPNIYGTLAASMLGIPVINNVCGLGTVFLKKNLVSYIACIMYKFAFRYPKKVFFQNDADLNLFLKRSMINRSITDLVPGSGIDLNHFAVLPFQKNKIFTFLMISRIIIDKGINEYIEAIRLLKEKGIEARFQLLGAMDEEHKRGISSTIIDQWIKSQTIEYLGTTDDVRSMINQADCIVLPSYREGTPRTLLEAASSGKPIIATNVPGCNHVVMDNFNGFLCDIKNAQDLATKMEAMLILPEDQLRTLGTNGRMKMEKEFSEDLVVTKYIHSINQLTA